MIPRASRGLPDHRLTGTWRLLSCEHELAGGGIVHPYGRDPVGRLVYTADGLMIVALMSSGRARFASEGLFDGTAAERACAAESFIAYSGTYEVRGDKVVHYVDISLFPNWTSSRQVRSFKLEGRRLTLATRPFAVAGVEQTARLVWERAG